MVAATYLQLWWPSFDRPVYVHRHPVWDGESYVDADTGEVLPTWAEALDQLAADPDAKPAHVMRFGRQVDMAGIIAPSEDADRAVRYLTKYLTKAVADTHTDPDAEPDPAVEAHVDRLHAELRYLPCSERCANWLRYGIQPDAAGPGLAARPLPVEGPRPRTPRPRWPPRPRLPAVVREAAGRAQGRPGHRRPRSPPRRRHRRPGDRTARRHRHPA